MHQLPVWVFRTDNRVRRRRWHRTTGKAVQFFTGRSFCKSSGRNYLLGELGVILYQQGRFLVPTYEPYSYEYCRTPAADPSWYMTSWPARAELEGTPIRYSM